MIRLCLLRRAPTSHQQLKSIGYAFPPQPQPQTGAGFWHPGWNGQGDLSSVTPRTIIILSTGTLNPPVGACQGKGFGGRGSVVGAPPSNPTMLLRGASPFYVLAATVLLFHCIISLPTNHLQRVFAQPPPHLAVRASSCLMRATAYERDNVPIYKSHLTASSAHCRRFRSMPYRVFSFHSFLLTFIPSKLAPRVSSTIYFAAT